MKVQPNGYCRKGGGRVREWHSGPSVTLILFILLNSLADTWYLVYCNFLMQHFLIEIFNNCTIEVLI